MNWHREYSTWGPLSSVIALNAPGPTQGDLLMSITIKPSKSAIRVRVSVPGTGEGNDQGGAVVLVQDGEMVGFSASLPSNTFFMLTPIDLERVLEVQPGVTTTLQVRCGPRQAGRYWIGGTWPWSGGLGTALGGGQSKATLDIEEIHLDDVPDAPLELYAFIGQSNMDGQAGLTGFPTFANRDRVRRFDVTNGYGPAFEPWNRDGPLYPVLNEAPAASQGSPILSCCDKLVSLRGVDIGGVATTKGGVGTMGWGTTSLATSTLWGAFVERTQQALAKAPAGSALKAVFTILGEANSDTQGRADEWSSDYLNIVGASRLIFGPDIVHVFAIIPPDPQSVAWPYWTRVQSNQASLVLPTGVGRVDLRDLGANSAGHLDAAGAVEAGHRLAAAAHALL